MWRYMKLKGSLSKEKIISECLAEKQHLKASDGKTQLVLKTHLGRIVS